MHPQNWRNRDDRYDSNQNLDRENRGGGTREPSRWDRDAEMEGRWAERHLADDRGRREFDDRGDNHATGNGDYSSRARRGYDQATVTGGYGYGSRLSQGSTWNRGERSNTDWDRNRDRDRLGPNFDTRGHQQGRYLPSGRYDERGFVSGDESSIKYSNRDYNPGFNSIYDRGTEMPGGRYFGKGPKNYARSDERIREEVCECLSNGRIDASDVEVVVQDGEVTLSGTVMDRRTKRLAEEMLDEISGVKDVENKLRIKVQGGEDFGQKERQPHETKKHDTKRATA